MPVIGFLIGKVFAPSSRMSIVAEFLSVANAMQTKAPPDAGSSGLSTLVTDLLRRRHAEWSSATIVKRRIEADTGRSRIGDLLRRFTIACAAFAVTSCIVTAPTKRAAKLSLAVQAPQHSVIIVVVTLDGVRWHEVFEGVDAKLAAEHNLPAEAVVSARELLPNLYSIIETHGSALGAPGHGSVISASGPNFLSLPGYAELLSGRSATGCANNQCPGVAARTIIEELSAGSARPDADVAAVTSWADIAKVTSLAPCAAAVSTGRRGGSNRELFARDPEGARLLSLAESAPQGLGGADFRPDVLTADLAIYHLKTRSPRFLFLGLGEADEFGHMNDYAGYLDSLRRADARIAEIDGELTRLAARGTRTALFITADHGRADSFIEHGEKYPESARVWLVASGSALSSRGFVPAPSERRLADLAPTMREIAHLTRDTDVSAGTPLFELLSAPAL
jgi:Metalloenzyme superfamily